MARSLKRDQILDSPLDVIRSNYAEMNRTDATSYVLDKSIAFLRRTLIRFDDILRTTSQDDLIVKESLSRSRNEIHTQVDMLIRLQIRLKRRKSQ